jgi:ubiquinone/menaquinone biosynthesis C-methylase UbiE
MTETAASYQAGAKTVHCAPAGCRDPVPLLCYDAARRAPAPWRHKMQTPQQSAPGAGYHLAGVATFLQRRTAQTSAGFLLPYLRPGLRLLDGGCGPGTITVGLAEAVTPGEVVGVDTEPVQIERGRALAGERGLTNLRFEVGDVTALPFEDATFDAAFVSQVLLYLPDPAVGLRELRRVLKPGGVLGVRDADVSALRLAPASDATRAFTQLFWRWREQGASPYYAPEQGRLLREAGFVRREAFADTEVIATLAATRAHAAGVTELLRARIWPMAVAQGWVGRETVDELAAGLSAWGDDPDALWVSTHLAALGWTA